MQNPVLESLIKDVYKRQVPGVGDGKDLIETVAGKDFITGETLSATDRLISGCLLYTSRCV